MAQSAISFTADSLELEGIVAKPDGLRDALPIVVMCNAHPGLFGALNNTLMDTLSNELVKAGIATFRFNYRGIGTSQGTFTNGEKETADVTAAIRIANVWPGINKGHVGLIGYSFGAGLLLKVPEKLKQVRAAVLIAPPVSSLVNTQLLKDKLPKLFLLGEQDRVAPPASIQTALSAFGASVKSTIVPKVNHSWRGGEAQTASLCVDFMNQHVR